MAVSVVLADGFSGEDVEIVVAGRTYQVGSPRTSPLTGMAAEVVVDDAVGDEPAGRDQIQVAARLAQSATNDPATPDRPATRGGPHASANEAALEEPTSYTLSPDEVLVLDLVGGQLTGRVMPGPVGFA